MVEERSTLDRRHTVRSAGRSGSDYAGISSEKTRGKRVRRKSKGLDPKLSDLPMARVKPE